MRTILLTRFAKRGLNIFLTGSMTNTVVSCTGAPSASSSLLLKTPKGMKDHDERETALRNKILEITTRVFKTYGAVTIDTPVMELKQILSEKYGEEDKLIYDLADQGGELCSLRYDLTVPLSRYLAQHGVKKLKRYQIGKVYRRDNPNISQGRLREFYQCDFDIVGQYDSMVPEVECLSVIVSVLEKLGIKDFCIKLNHRGILDGIFLIAGVPSDKIRTVSSSIDKLDKKPWTEIEDELVNIKNINSKTVEIIKKYVLLESEPVYEMCQKLMADPVLSENKSIMDVVHQMVILSDYIKHCSIYNKVEFSLSLARGLDYYTGVLFETVLTNKDAGRLAELGSVAAGGRYDNLVQAFSGNKVCCVGFSIGCERLFSLLSSKLDMSKLKPSSTQVMVAGLGSVDHRYILEICSELRSGGIPTETPMKTGSKELESNTFTIKYVLKNAELDSNSRSWTVARSELPSKLRELISSLDSPADAEKCLDFYYS